MKTITFTSTKRTVCMVANYMAGTTILPALAVALAGKSSMDDPVTVTLNVESVLQIRQVMSVQQEGHVAKVNKELEDLLSAEIMKAPAQYPELIAQLARLDEVRVITRNQIAEAGLSACTKVLELVNLNRQTA
jgi:hypothetical protein